MAKLVYTPDSNSDHFDAVDIINSIFIALINTINIQTTLKKRLLNRNFKRLYPFKNVLIAKDKEY